MIDHRQIIHEAMLSFLKEARREPEEIMAARQDALKNLKDAEWALQKEQPARHIQAIFAAIDTSALRPNEKSALGNLKGLVRRAMRMGDVGLDARAQMKEEVPDLIKLISRQQPPALPKPRERAQQPSMGPPVLRRHAPRLATLRKQLIRLAHENPGEIREALLPLLTAAKKDLGKPEVIHGMKFGGTRYKYNYGINIDHIEKDGDFLVWQVGKTTKKHGKAKSLKEAEKLALRKCEFTTKPSH